MATMGQCLADSHLPVSEEPLVHEDSENSQEIRATFPNDDQSWRAAFGTSYK